MAKFIFKILTCCLIIAPLITRAQSLSCKQVLSDVQVQKLEVLQKASMNLARGLFSQDDILASPERFKKFLKRLDGVELNSVKSQQVEMLVEKYLAAVIQDYRGFLGAAYKGGIYPAASLRFLSQHYANGMLNELKSQGIDVSVKKYQMTNRMRTVAFISVWSAIAIGTQSYWPVYMPGYQKQTLTQEQKKLLAEKLPDMSPQEAIVFLQKTLPNVRGLELYQGIQRTYLRLSGLMLASAVLFSQPSLYALDKYTPVGAPLKEIKAEVLDTWDQATRNREELEAEVLAVRATLEGIDPADEIATEELRISVHKMTKRELIAFLN